MMLIQIFAVAYLLILFHAGLSTGFLARMPGSQWNEHAHFIVMLLIPLSWWSAPLWVFGVVAYVDDYRQHYIRAHGRPDYRSPLHLWGWYRIGEPLKRWLARNVWEEFDRVG